MEQTVTAEKKNPKKRIWLRVVAALLVLGMLATAGLIEASRIVFNAASGANGAEAPAAEYIGDTTGYLDANTAERMAMVLDSYTRKPVTYEDHYLRMSIGIAREKYADAVENCEKCIELWSDEKDETLDALWTKLGCLYALLGEYAPAGDALSRAIELGKAEDSASLYLLRAQMYVQTGEPAAALKDIESYEAVSGDNGAFMQVKGPLYELAGEYAAAETAYTAALEANEAAPDAAVYANRARVRLFTENYAGAREDAEAFFDAGLADDTGATRYILGVCCMQLGDYAAAKQAFELALEEGYPSPMDIYPSLVYVKYMLNDLDGALETGEIALSQGGDTNAELNEWMGIIYMGRSDYASARDYFQKSVQLDDTRERIHYYIGVCAVSLEDYQTALDEFSVSIERGEALAECYYNRGVCNAALGYYTPAAQDMRSAIAATDDAQLIAQAQELLDELEALPK